MNQTIGRLWAKTVQWIKNASRWVLGLRSKDEGDIQGLLRVMNRCRISDVTIRIKTFSIGLDFGFGFGSFMCSVAGYCLRVSVVNPATGREHFYNVVWGTQELGVDGYHDWLNWAQVRLPALAWSERNWLMSHDPNFRVRILDEGGWEVTEYQLPLPALQSSTDGYSLGPFGVGPTAPALLVRTLQFYAHVIGPDGREVSEEGIHQPLVLRFEVPLSAMALRLAHDEKGWKLIDPDIGEGYRADETWPRNRTAA